MKLRNKRDCRYYFRVDGNGKIGAGHLMRCLTIAQELANQLGGRDRICFLTAWRQSAELTESKGFRTVLAGTEDGGMEEELPLLYNFFNEEEKLFGSRKRCILVDSYSVTDHYLAQLGSICELWLMDDLGRHTYPVDAVINYNLYASSLKYRELYERTKTDYYLGSRYVPLRSQFLEADYEVKDPVQNVLVTTGGGDRDNIASAVLEAIWREEIHYHVVAGRFNPHVLKWKARERTCSWLHVYVDVTNMAALMEKCDFAVTAGGSTVYELASMGVPFLCFSYAENQEALAEYFGENRIAGYAGKFHKEPEKVLEELGRQSRELEKDSSKRRYYSMAEKRLVDGRGAERISELLIRDSRG